MTKQKKEILLEVTYLNGYQEWFDYATIELAIERATELRAWFGYECVIYDENGKQVEF